MSTFVIIPAYNEAARIGRVIADIQERYGKAYRLVIVDDGSCDSTAKVAKAAGVKVLRHPVNRGQGAALQTGNDFALSLAADHIVHFDADGQHDPADIARLLEPLQQGRADIVLGSRFLDHRNHKNTEITKTQKNLFLKLPVTSYQLLVTRDIPFLRRTLLLGSLMTNYLITQLPLTDAHNGLRAMNQKAAKHLRLTQDGMAHNTEYPQLIHKHKLSHAEIPVKVRYNQVDKQSQNFFDGIKILKELVWKLFIKF